MKSFPDFISAEVVQGTLSGIMSQAGSMRGPEISVWDRKPSTSIPGSQVAEFPESDLSLIAIQPWGRHLAAVVVTDWAGHQLRN